MKLILSLPVLIVLGKFVFAQVNLMGLLDFSGLLPLTLGLDNSSRETCVDHNRECALITYNIADRKYIRVLDRDCNCEEGTECLYDDKDILSDCEENEDCLHYRNLFLNYNLSAYQYVCKPKQNLCTQSQDEAYAIALENSIWKEIDPLDNEIPNLHYEIANVLQAAEYEKETPHLEYQIAHFDYGVASLEQLGTHLQNFTIHPENKVAHTRFSQLNRRIKQLVSRTEQLTWNVGRITLRIKE